MCDLGIKSCPECEKGKRVGRPRSCTPRDRFCGPYNIAIAIIVGAAPLGIGADGRAAAELYPEGSVLRALQYRHRHHRRCCSPRDRC